MFLRAYVVLLLMLVCITTCLAAEKPRKFKKAFSEANDKKYWNLQEKLERLKKEEAELEAELEEELEEEIDSGAGRVSDIIDFSSLPQASEEEEGPEPQENPCREIFCAPGKECMINSDGKGVCQCVEKCENIEDERRKVCSNYNETWISDCELYKMRCLCSEGSSDCRNEKYEHMHIDYYGGCQMVQECEEPEMADFPRRMREWLFNIMRDMAYRKELGEHYMEMEKKAEEDVSKKWINAAVWKWCELDGHPRDKAVSRHELFPLRAPLYTLEHCISPFLDSCDPNDDHLVFLDEWTKCLQLSEDLSDDMIDLCEKIRE